MQQICQGFAAGNLFWLLASLSVDFFQSPERIKSQTGYSLPIDF